MDNSLRFDDLPVSLRRLAAAIHLLAAIALLWSWRTLPALLARPVVPWLGLAVSAAISLGTIYILTRIAISLMRQPKEAPVPPTTPPRHRALTYYLAAVAFAAMGLSAPAFDHAWYVGLIFLLLAVGALGEAYRARRAPSV